MDQTRNPGGRGKEPFLSACMIVRNEEGCLARCLESIRAHVDEIVVVDTGSTDGTVAIAEGFGARVYHHPWENDFSRHRNQSLGYATGDWILQIDADEELFAGDGPRLRETLRSGGADYYFLRFYDLKRDGSVHGLFNLIRLFRNGLGMHFTQKVHNQLQVRGTGLLSGIRVKHYGYDLPPEKMEQKFRRTATLLKEMLAENPEDAYSRHQLASSYSMHGDFALVVEEGEKVLAQMRRQGLRNDFLITTFYTVAQAYLALADPEAAERTGREALDFFPMHLDICHLLAAVYFRRGDLAACKAVSQRYLEIYDAFTRNPSLIGSFYCHSPAKRHEIHFGLACIHFFEGDLPEADACFQRAFADAERRAEKAESICRFYLERGLDEPALQWLIRACESTPPAPADPAAPAPGEGLIAPLAYDTAEALCRRGRWELAGQALRLAVAIDPARFDPARFDRLLKGARTPADAPA